MTDDNDKLDSNIQIGTSDLTAALGASDDEDLELLGRGMMYTVGDVVVPREWLLEQADELDIPERLLPTETTPHSAFKRAMDYLTRDGYDARAVDAGGTTVRVEFRVKKTDGKTRHLIADAHFGDVAEDGGVWRHYDLGAFHYDVEAQGMVARKDEDCPVILNERWEKFVGRAHNLFRQMEQSHTGNDIRNIAYSLRYKWTDSILPLRDAGAVYFVPEGELTEIVNSIATLYDRINEEFKEDGKDVEIRTFEVVDTDDKREWVRHRVEKNLESVVDSAFEDAFDALKNDEETVDEIVEVVAGELDAATNTADNYNDLLQSRLSVERVLTDKLDAVDDNDKEDIIQRVLNDNGIAAQ